MRGRVKDAATGTTLTNQQMANAAAAIETIATNNRQLLEHKFNTSASDVLALVSLGKAHWYQLASGRKE